MRFQRAVTLCILALLAVNSTARSQAVHPTPAPQAQAVPLTGPIRLDGKLDEDIWRTAPPATDFRQNQPREGQPATQRTEVRFAFDDAAIYVGARMFDSLGAAGVRTRLVRRDADAASDYLQVIFDTYHDHIGRLFFLVNPSGVINDANGLGGGGDPSWDPVWEVKTTIDSLGWTAEMRIPFAELRYPRSTEPQTWGLQIWRQVNRINELSQWSFWGIQEAGGPARFGHMGGLVISRAPGRGEVLPYVVGRSANAPVSNPSDPFQDAHSADGRFGADARILLTSNLALNATVNPDFGQVEVDPAVVNLTAFETFFDEKRPFFVEGAGYFGFGGLNCYFCSNVSSLSTFYSRRIGRAPSMAGNAFRNGPYADVPDNTSILGAAKLTGRTRSGWSIGVLDAVTARTRGVAFRIDTLRDTTTNAIISTTPVNTYATVEPPANYFVGRFQRDFRGGATQIRGIATSVIRDLGDDAFLKARLTSHSEVVGLGSDWYFGRRDYRLMAQFAMTSVSGDTAAIRRLQVAPYRLWQRPDRHHGSNGVFSDSLDPTQTSLRGIGGYARFSRETGGWLWEIATNFRTPGFENNDIAALSRVDYWWMNGNVLRQWTRPSSWYRSLFFIMGAQQQYNFDGDLTDRQFHGYFYVQPHNYWNFSVFYIRRPSLLDDRLARGGPVLKRVSQNFGAANLSTDNRKQVVVDVFADLGCNAERYCSRNLGMTARIRPASNVSISLGPSIGHSETGIQFVRTKGDTTANATYDVRYIFADVTQNSVSMNTRVNITFNTKLTFELFVQPLIAAGRYDRFNEFAATRSTRRVVFGDGYGTRRDTLTSFGPNPTDTVTVHVLDPDGAGPADTIQVRNPNFALRSLRGNAVLRWEYRPGSTIYLVWTRSASSQLMRGSIDFGDDSQALLRAPSTNIFLVKVNYRIGL